MPKSVKFNKKYFAIFVVVSLIVISFGSWVLVQKRSNSGNSKNSPQTVSKSFDEVNHNKQVQGIDDSEMINDLESTPQKVTDDQIETKESVSTVVHKLSSVPKTTTPAPAPIPSPCPVSTKSCIPCSIGQSLCRYESGATSGFLGWACQNNNLGNIRYSTARIGYITKHGGPAPCGERIDSRGGTYMIFSTYQDGRNALRAYLLALNAGTHTAYPECASGNCDLIYVFSKYAPGDTNYAQNIADRLGVTADTKFRWVVENKMEQLLNAIEIKEGFFSN